MTSRAAVDNYMSYAQKQLAQACGNVPVASESLTLLGKLTIRIASEVPSKRRLSRPQARTCYEAALLVHGKNHVAANELGVLLSGNGDLTEAREKFQRSVWIRSDPVAWKNLADVHQRLGEQELAKKAMGAWQLAMASQQRDIAAQGKLPGSAPFESVSPDEFRLTGQEEFFTVTTTPSSTNSDQETDRTAFWRHPWRSTDKVSR